MWDPQVDILLWRSFKYHNVDVSEGVLENSAMSPPSRKAYDVLNPKHSSSVPEFTVLSA